MGYLKLVIGQVLRWASFPVLTFLVGRWVGQQV